MAQYSSIKNISVKVSCNNRQTGLTRSQYSDCRVSVNSQAKSHCLSNNMSASNIMMSQSNSEARPCSGSKCESLKNSRVSDFKACKESQKYMKQLLKKAFGRSLELIDAGEVLTQNNMVDILSCLGLFSDPPTQKDIVSAKKIDHILDRHQRGIKRSNLLKLILIVNKVPVDTEATQMTDNPSSGLRRDTDEQLTSEQNLVVGTINQCGVWVTNEEDQKVIRSQFGHLYYNKIANQNVKYIKHPQQEEYSFKPKILASSSQIGANHRRRVLSSVSNGDIKSVQQLLILHQRFNESRLQEKSKQVRLKELQHCTFKPHTNKSDVASKVMHVYRPEFQKKRLTSLEVRELKEMRQCSFKPHIVKYKENRETAVVKNELKMVNRLKDAYNKRQVSNTIRQRGYPKETNWNTFMNNAKKNKKQKKPILSIDIKISSLVEVLNIYEGESLESLVCKILVKNKLPYEYQKNVESLLMQVLEESTAISLLDGFIYAK